ncbi:MAG: hypothetical protein ACXVNF_13185, partial [Neobacillus sp.]
VLAGDDLDKRQAIESFFILIESLMRFVCDKNYYTLANEKRGMWALLIFYYIPLTASMLSIYKKEFGIPQNLVSNGYMLPIMKSNKLVTPTLLLKRYLKEIVDDSWDKNDEYFNFQHYISDLKSNITPRYKTKFIIINELRNTTIHPEKNTTIHPEKLQEIESIIDCAIFSSHVYQELCRYFKDKKQAYMLIEYFRKCLDICDKGLIDAADNIQLPEEFKAFVLSHLDCTINEFYYTEVERKSYGSPIYEKLKNNRDKCRSYLFHTFASYLYETKISEADTLEDIDINGLYKVINKYNPDHMISSSDKDHDDIVNLLYGLKFTFQKPKNDLNEKEIINILEEIKSNKYFMNYEHEFLYYNALNYLAKNDFSKAIEQLKLARKKCKKITAGETAVSASNLLILLRLLCENKTGYSHLNPEIQSIIDSQPEEVISRPLQNLSEDEAHKKTYRDKTIALIERFNANGYCCYNGFTCEKLNPLRII